VKRERDVYVIQDGMATGGHVTIGLRGERGADDSELCLSRKQAVKLLKSLLRLLTLELCR